MGMFDEFSAKVKCADCGFVNELSFEQTKDFNCELAHFREGDMTCNYSLGNDVNPSYEFFYPSVGKFWSSGKPNNECKNCRSAMEIIGVLRNSRIMRILDGRILSQEVIN